MELNDEMVVHGPYGVMPVHLRRMIGRFNVSPEEWAALTRRFGTDWDGMRQFILDNISKTTYKYVEPK